MLNTKFFVTGANGQLGRDLVHEFTARNLECIASDIQDNFAGPESCKYVQLDITDYDSVRNALTQERPDRIIHCAAWTAVDSAEDEANKPKVFAINSTGTENIARVCAELNDTPLNPPLSGRDFAAPSPVKGKAGKGSSSSPIVMTYISTDYIFNGQGTEAWKPDDESYSPLNYYGLTKLQGELAVKKYLSDFFIVRIAWVFGPHGNNFVRTMLNLAKTHNSLRVVNDQIGTPTYTPDLAKLLVDMNLTNKFGVYNATNDEQGRFISWYDFACEIFSQAGININVTPVSTLEYGLSKARRPSNSRLDKSKLKEAGFELLPDWKDALRRYLITNADNS
ncbi:MAG: sugar nucleotide-binding protein [Synergistaceae bacterium]|nr:sugar nucleotide-binding protein [Synergistaceae bacterium]MBQ9596168.1 sugar nucleotide-binding protein [Synergistaceae bacterium]MBR0203704.1 sugar nucleotide-binding protein [Synergistaceae bacterium]